MGDDLKDLGLVQAVHPQKEIEHGCETRDGRSKEHPSGPKYTASFVQRTTSIRLFNEVVERTQEENYVGRSIRSVQVAGVADLDLYVRMRGTSLFYVKLYRIDQVDPMTQIC